jgi:hypothetical protein
VVGEQGTVISSAAFTTFAHWDGTAWTIAPPPPLADGIFNQISSMWGSATNDIWAVGPSGNPLSAEALHFDGVSWTVATDATVTIPDPGTESGADPNFFAVWGTCAADVWIAGSNANPQDPRLIRHFDGSSWSTVVLPVVPAQFEDELFTITGTSADDIWTGGGDGPLIGGGGSMHLAIF